MSKTFATKVHLFLRLEDFFSDQQNYTSDKPFLLLKEMYSYGRDSILLIGFIPVILIHFA
jgi:hypothetical protein